MNTWNQFLYPQWSRHCRRWGSERAQVFGDHDTVRARGPLGNTRMGFGPKIGDGVATRMKLRNTLQQLDSAEDTQKPSSEIGFKN